MNRQSVIPRPAFTGIGMLLMAVLTLFWGWGPSIVWGSSGETVGYPSQRPARPGPSSSLSMPLVCYDGHADPLVSPRHLIVSKEPTCDAYP